MVDLRRWRAPVAVILLAALAVRVGAGLAGVIQAAVNHSGALTDLVGLGVGAGDVALIVAVAAVCWSCAADDVRGTRVLATVGFILVTLQLSASIAASVGTLVLRGGDRTLGIAAVVVQVTWLVVPSLAAAVLLRSALFTSAKVGSARAFAARAPESTTGPLTAPGIDAADQPEPDESAEQSFHEAAGWEPHEAAGAAWTTAGEAARGGSASGWGSDAGSGWEPADWPARPAPQAELRRDPMGDVPSDRPEALRDGPRDRLPDRSEALRDDPRDRPPDRPEALRDRSPEPPDH